MGRAAANINTTITANQKQLKSELLKAEASVKQFNKSVVAAQRKLKRFGKKAANVGKDMSAKFTLPLALAAGASVKMFADFEQQIAKVKAISGATAPEIKKLSDLAENLGRTTRYTASQVAELELNYSKLGFSPQQIQKITKSTLDLALATGEDLAESAEVAGATLRGFGLEADQMGRVVDVMAMSFSSSALNLQKFQDSMKTVAPVANAVNASIEDTTGILSVLVSNGQEASTAGTSLRNIFIELANKGISWDDAMSQINGSQNKLSTATKLFGKRAATSALIIASNSDEISKLSNEYREAGGSATKMAEIMDDTLTGSLLKVKSAIEGAAIKMGKVLAPMVDKLSGYIADLANWFSELSPGMQKTIAIIGGVVAAIGPLLVGIGFVSTGFSALLPVIIAAGVALKAFFLTLTTNPIGIAITAIAALVIGTYSYLDSLVEVNKELSLNEKLNSRISKAGEKFNTELNKEKKYLRNIFSALKDENTAKSLKRSLAEEINQEYGEYLPNLLDENSTLQDIQKAQDSINSSMERRIALTLGQSEVTSIIKEYRKEETRLQDILKKSGMTRDQISTFTEGASSLEELASAASAGANSFVEIDGKLVSVASTIRSLIRLEGKQNSAVEKILRTYQDLVTITDGIDTIESAQGYARGVDVVAKKLAKAMSGQDMIPLEIQMKRLIEAAKLYSQAFGEGTEEAIDRQRDALQGLISEQLEGTDTITPEIQNLIDKYNELGNQLTATGNAAVGFSEKFVNGLKKIGEIIRVAQEIYRSFGAIVGQSFKNQEILMESRFEKEREQISKTTMSEENKEKAFIALEKRIEKEKQKILIKKAKADKISGIISATISTAVGVASALEAGPAGIPLSVIIGALGAAEIATIAAQPIPSFSEGGIVSSPMTAVVGDATSPEAIVPIDKLSDIIERVVDPRFDKLDIVIGEFSDMVKELKKVLEDLLEVILEKGYGGAINALVNAVSIMSRGIGMPIGGIIAGRRGRSALGAVPTFGKGGLVTGPTMGLIGEGAGTSSINPEVIAPLDKLKGLLSDTVRVVVEGRISGEDIILVQANANRNLNFIR